VTTHPLWDLDKNLKGFRVVIQDFTERDRMERDLEASRATLAGILDSAAEAIVSIDESRSIRLFNKGAENIFGYPASEVVGQSLDMLVPERFRAAHAKHIEGFANSPARARLMGERGRLRGLRKDGTEFPIEASISKLDNGTGKILTVVLRDVTEQDAAQELAQRAQAATQEVGRLAAVGQLAAGVAHSVNNPLAAISGLSQLLLMEQLPDNVKQDVKTIGAEAERASAVVKSLLTFARQTALSKHYLSLSGLLKEAAALKNYSLQLHGISVNLRVEEGLPQTMVDRNQVMEVFMNILNNDEDAMVESGKGSRITVAAASAGKDIRISFTDDGPGIPKDIIGKIFEPFFTTKELGKGTGLGLSMARGVVEQHGGRLWAESTPGQGATFHIELPIIPPG
jgi:PAS domain S-box-containing protein